MPPTLTRIDLRLGHPHGAVMVFHPAANWLPLGRHGRPDDTLSYADAAALLRAGVATLTATLAKIDAAAAEDGVPVTLCPLPTAEE